MQPLKHDEFLKKWIEENLRHKTKEEIEDFLGIEIKYVGEDKRTSMYNIYIKGTDIVHPWNPSYFIDNNGLIQKGMNMCVKFLRENAIEDTILDAETAKNIDEEWERQKKAEYEANLVKCPICGERHPKGSHGHWK